MKRPSSSHWANNFTQEECEVINKAFTLVEKNASIDDHCSIISDILDHINADAETITAAVLVTSLLYSDLPLSLIESNFDKSVVALANESFSLMQEEAEWYAELVNDERKPIAGEHHMMLLSMMKDTRAVFILLSLQMLKMRKLVNVDDSKKQKAAIETQLIFAPLANRLGIGQIKWELEDYAFRFLHPDQYKKIAQALEEKRIDRERYMEEIVSALKAKLIEEGVEAEVYGRPKHIFSIWSKMQKKHLKFDELFDVRAVRIIAKDVETCYSVLSIVHEMWQFIPGEYDDYIASPKVNNYQSLHTAVLGPQDRTVEIQIRTENMHSHAELGVAAHWRYKEGGKRDAGLEAHLESVRELLSDENEESPLGSSEAISPKIYVLSPKGNVVALPRGATPLDFAYTVHSEVGNRCRGAMVNGKMVPLTTKLNSGETVEIITAKNATPSRDWLIPHLGYITSNRARSKVKHWFKREFRNEHIHTGKAALAKEMHESLNHSELNQLAQIFNVNNIDDLYAAIGRGELGVHQVLNSYKKEQNVAGEEPEEIAYKRPTQKKNQQRDIIIEGIDELMSQLARCCKPVPGDEIVGFITKGRGVTIHRSDCQNISHLKTQYSERLIPVSWGEQRIGKYDVDIEVIAMDRSGLLRDVTSVISSVDVNVNGANTYSDRKTHQAKMRLTIEISSPEQLEKVLTRLMNLKDVLDVSRIK